MVVNEYSKVAANWWAKRLVGAPEEKVAMFEEKLTEAIDNEVNKCPYFSLTSDFTPCCFLSDIAKECGISISLFPWKTIMNIKNGRVTVNYGYGVRPEVLCG